MVRCLDGPCCLVRRSLRNKRGRTVVLVFSNQGLGNLCNTAIILALMAITGQYGPKYNTSEYPAAQFPRSKHLYDQKVEESSGSLDSHKAVCASACACAVPPASAGGCHSL